MNSVLGNEAGDRVGIQQEGLPRVGREVTFAQRWNERKGPWKTSGRLSSPRSSKQTTVTEAGGQAEGVKDANGEGVSQRRTLSWTPRRGSAGMFWAKSQHAYQTNRIAPAAGAEQKELAGVETVKDDRRKPLETLWLAREWERGHSREVVGFYIHFEETANRL